MNCKRIGFPAFGRVAAGAILLAAVAGCSLLHRGGAGTAASAPAGPVAPNADRWKVKADTTPFYRYGPQQLGGSDLDLKKDARITMIQRAHGYSQIRTVDNQVGFVGTEDVTPLTPEEIAAEDAQKLAASAPPGALSGMPTGGGGPAYTIPSEAGRSESLPTQDANPTPKPPPATIFRY